jgi:hypothetical protein
MATTITQKPNLLSAVNTPMIYILKESSSTIYNGFKFRYVLKVEVNGTEKAVIKIHKNQQNVGVFDISHILKTYVSTQLTNLNNESYSIHSVGIQETAKPFSQNDGQCTKVEVKAFYEVATSATTAPVLSSQQAAATSYYIPATTPFTKTASNVGGLDIINVADSSFNNFPLTYFMNSVSDEDNHSFLTNAPTVQFVRGSSTSADNLDQLTICFKQGGGASLITQGDKIDYIAIEYFDSTDTVIAGTTGSSNIHFFVNENANGGANATQSTDVKQAILYFGCGTKNIETQTDDVLDSSEASVSGANARPSNFSNWAYYRIYGASKSNPSFRTTKYYYFYRYGASRTGIDDRHQSCTRYDNIRLAWRNRLGAWDYMNFRGKSTKTLSIENNDMESVAGNWDTATENTFNYNNWDRGKKTLFKTATRKIQINSDLLNEDEAVWLEELFTSDNVQILDDDYTIIYPVVITDKAYTTKTSVNDKVQIQYTINLEYANKVRTNS